MSGETETLVSKNEMETSSSVSEAHSTVNCMFSSMEFNTQALESLTYLYHQRGFTGVVESAIDSICFILN